MKSTHLHKYYTAHTKPYIKFPTHPCPFPSVRLQHAEQRFAINTEMYVSSHYCQCLNCAVVSLKPEHTDWVQDFDFMLNLFSLPSP